MSFNIPLIRVKTRFRLAMAFDNGVAGFYTGDLIDVFHGVSVFKGVCKTRFRYQKQVFVWVLISKP